MTLLENFDVYGSYKMVALGTRKRSKEKVGEFMLTNSIVSIATEFR